VARIANPWKYATRNTQYEKQRVAKLNNKQKHRKNSAFTACTAGTSLLETLTDAAEVAAWTATMLLSTARSSFDEFQNARKCG